MIKYVVKSNVKKYLLAKSKERRNGKFTRVSASVYEHLDFVMKQEMDRLLHAHPSVGKTITV